MKTAKQLELEKIIKESQERVAALQARIDKDTFKLNIIKERIENCEKEIEELRKSCQR